MTRDNSINILNTNIKVAEYKDNHFKSQSSSNNIFPEIEIIKVDLMLLEFKEGLFWEIATIFLL